MSQGNPIGKLEIKVCSCKALKDVELVGKNSPYVTLKVGTENFKTSVKDDAGTSCVWNQNFIFNLDGKTDPVMNIRVFDKNTVSSDTEIGRLDLKLQDFCATAAEQKFQIVDPTNFKKIAGELYLQCVSYKGTVLTNQPPAPAPAPAAPAAMPAAMAGRPMVMAGAPQVVYMQQPMAPQVVYVQQPAQPQIVYYQSQS